MTGARQPHLLTVIAGTFQSQPLAFAALLKVAGRWGAAVDLADVDVIREAREVRLAHYFRPAITARIIAAAAQDETLLILRPSVLTANPMFPGDAGDLRLIGRFAGELVEPGKR